VKWQAKNEIFDADRDSKKIDKIHLLKAKNETFDVVRDSNKIDKIHLLKPKNETLMQIGIPLK
jgi:hypothetical protein